MKKIFIFIGVMMFTTLLIGCGGLFDPITSVEKTYETLPPIQGNTIYSIDEDMIISDLYARIYESLYDEVKAEVIEDISEEKFQELYDSVILALLSEVEAGNIEISAASVIDMIMQIEENQASTVVGIKSFNANGVMQAVGSGVIYKQVGDKYYVLTNNHVVETGVAYTVVFEDGSEKTAILRGVDQLVDVAVLYFLSNDTYNIAEFGDSKSIQKGQMVVAVGHPSGFNYFGSMTLGIISGINRFFDIDNDGVTDMFVGYIQHDAAINSGNSGGALFDLDGKLIGVNVIKITAVNVEGMGFAIPANLVEAIVSDIEEFGYSNQKPYLGIRFIDIASNPTYFTQNGISLPEGVTKGFFIESVEPDGSLADYVQAGDIITFIDDIELESSRQFVEEFSEYRVGDIISITIIRNGETILINNIELKAAPLE